MDPETYETRDLYFAAYLNLKVELIGVRKEKEWSPRKSRHNQVTYFVFRNDSSIPDLKSLYFSGRGEVSALAYADSVRNLKALLHV